MGATIIIADVRAVSWAAMSLTALATSLTGGTSSPPDPPHALARGGPTIPAPARAAAFALLGRFYLTVRAFNFHQADGLGPSQPPYSLPSAISTTRFMISSGFSFACNYCPGLSKGSGGNPIPTLRQGNSIRFPILK